MTLGSWFLFFFSIFYCLSAEAARVGTVDAEQIEVRQKPDLTSTVLEQLPRGSPIQASNHPAEGFHKIRTQSGILGWVPVNSLHLEPAPSVSEQDETSGKVPLKSREERVKSTPMKVRVRLLGGMDFFSLGGVINNLGSLGGGYHFGGELCLMVTGPVGIVFRGESIFNSTRLTDSVSGLIYQVSVNSLPIELGFEYVLLGKAFSIHFGLLGGVTIPTSITTTLSSTGDVSRFLNNSFTLLGRVNCNWQFAEWVSVFLEGGYRSLVTSGFTPTNAPGTAAGILQSSFNLNLTGAMMSAGLSFGF